MVPSQKNIVIIGGGYGGIAAAYDLARAGHKVTVLEKDEDIGGLAGTFELQPGIRAEKFYHHWFTSDEAVLSLIEELGLSDRLKYCQTNTGLFYANSIFRLASPLDLLKFTPIPLIDRIRTGLMALRARRISDWRLLEDVTSEEWIIKTGGRKAYEVIWQPLLQGKFGCEAANVSAVWFWNKLKLRGSSRNSKGAESLVYFDGGFGALTETLGAAVRRYGVEIQTGIEVSRINTVNGAVNSVDTNHGTFSADAVLSTIPLPTFLQICPDLPRDYAEHTGKIGFLGNVCLVLRLKRSLSSTYWLNVADPTFPFVAVIEHTNIDPTSNYGGDHIAYISKYLPTSEAMFKMSELEVYEYALPYLMRIFPEFNRDWVNGFRVWKASYSQPVISKHYSQLIPEMKTPVKNLWLSTMAQIYPEDRGTNYAVKYGRDVARKIAQSF